MTGASISRDPTLRAAINRWTRAVNAVMACLENWNDGNG
jgi:hypothetical protein